MHRFLASPCGRFLYTDLSRIPRQRRREVQAPCLLRFAIALMIPSFLSIYIAVFLNIGINHQWMSGRCSTPLVGDALYTCSNSACSHSKGSVALHDLPNEGFGEDQDSCQNACASLSACRMFVFGTWQSGPPQSLGGHYGEDRCRLYATCALDGMSRNTVFAKSKKGFVELQNSIPPPAYLAPIPFDIIALAAPQTSGLCFIIALWYASVRYCTLRAKQDPILLILVLLNFINALLLALAHWMVSSTAEHIQEEVEETFPNVVQDLPARGTYQPPGVVQSAGSQALAQKGLPPVVSRISGKPSPAVEQAHSSDVLVIDADSPCNKMADASAPPIRLHASAAASSSPKGSFTHAVDLTSLR